VGRPSNWREQPSCISSSHSLCTRVSQSVASRLFSPLRRRNGNEFSWRLTFFNQYCSRRNGALDLCARISHGRIEFGLDALLLSRYIESGRRMFYGFFFAGLIFCILTHFVTVLLWPLCLFYACFNSANFRDSARSLLFVLPVLAFVFAITGSNTTTQSAFHFYSHSTSQLDSLLTFALDGIRAYLWLLGRDSYLWHIGCRLRPIWRTQRRFGWVGWC
jgi:hypothetical protein